MARTARDRFFDKVEQPAYGGSCWLWQASKNPEGYGHFQFEGRVIGAHRASYLLFRGEVPEGLLICHTCDNPACVNPDHLFLGDHQANADDKMRKGRHAEKNQTHCRRGHELTPDNLYVKPGSGLRVCRHCARMVCREHDRKRRPPKQGPRLNARKTVEDLPRVEVAA
jgi:hypothetical protein